MLMVRIMLMAGAGLERRDAGNGKTCVCSTGSMFPIDTALRNTWLFGVTTPSWSNTT